MDLDTDTLPLSLGDAPPKAGKVDADALLAWLAEVGQLTARQVMQRFDASKTTALAALAALPGVDSYEGVRGTRYFRVTP